MIAKILSLALMFSLSTLAAANVDVALPDDQTDGTVCKDCEKRRILNDRWNGASPAQRVEIAKQLAELNGKATPPLNGTTTGQ